MTWDPGNSTLDLKRDIARWRKDLAMFSANSAPAETIREWINIVEGLISPL
jgi:hypothetical protein